MTTTTDEHDLVRQQYFDCDGPVEVDIELGSGSIEVRFEDGAGGDTTRTGTAGGGEAGGDDLAAQPATNGASAGAASGATAGAGGDADGSGAAGEPWAGEAAAAGEGAFTDEGFAEGGGDRGFTGEGAFTDEGFAEGAFTEGRATSADDTGVLTDQATAADGTATGSAAGNDQPAIVVQVRHDPKAGSNWGIAGLLNWVGREFGGQAPDIAVEAVRQTTVSVHGNRLTIRGPRAVPLRGVPLAITVHAPAGSSLQAKAGAADVRVGGTANRVNVSTGSGDVSVDRADGQAQVKSGSGTLRLGPMRRGLHSRTGSGDVEVAALEGDGSLVSGSGNIWVGSMHGGHVSVKTGSGDLTVAEATQGSLQLVSGSGDLRVGIRQGVLAEVDVMSGSGRARTDLPMSDAPPSRDEATLRIRARTGSGDAVVGRATA